ncbi:uncharacterized protein LOC101889694 isoform X3 [Musca domestica]|uniref:Uncharacterized protein LOC101889694 isoform X3 n=1 Tax=Musca domestica TaxID=7370 RepID=A0A9J7ID61_MUSDO|nr:uncharacterized protein LOC101889694 isoform X3 [Musca domestica]
MGSRRVCVWSVSIGTTYLTVFLKQIKEFSVHRLKDAWKSQYFKSLLCYTCSYSWGSVDDSCITKPTHQTNCTKKYCTIVRQELVREHGKVATFLRGCEDKLEEYNSVVTDSTYKTYYRSCISDLCNDSDGKRPISSADPNVGAIENMIIKGKPRK